MQLSLVLALVVGLMSAGSAKHYLMESKPSNSHRASIFEPPKDLIALYSGCQDLPCVRKISIIYTAALIELLDLTENSVFLDVGCGIGRIASGLAIFFGRHGTGKYEGFDIGSPAIEWNKNAYKNLLRFNFRHADIYSKMYNSKGVLFAHNYSFPYDDNSFDAVFLGSVFTHDYPDAIDNFLSEIRRVMKPGSCSLISWFILNDESEAFQKKGKANPPIMLHLPSHPESANFKVASIDNPEAAIAYTEARMRRFYFDADLTIKFFFQGMWSGRPRSYGYRGWEGGHGYQDAVLACKSSLS